MIVDGKKIIRVFVRRMNQTPDDDFVFIGDPPFEMLIPEADEVHVSVTFTWDLKEGKRLQRAWSTYLPTKIGGPGMGDPGGEFTPGLYLKQGVTITTRGCPRNCEFCFVPSREGKIRCLEIKDGFIVQDNNLMAAPMPHIEQVFEMLKRQKNRAIFSGGIDARLLNEKKVQLFKDLKEVKKLDRLILAYDSPAVYDKLVEASKLFSFLNIRRDKVCYVLIGFQDDTTKKAEARMRQVWDLDMTPFPMYYADEQNLGKKENKAWKKIIADWTTRLAAYSHMKKIEAEEKGEELNDANQLRMELK